jgi:hypothetical protein
VRRQATAHPAAAVLVWVEPTVAVRPVAAPAAPDAAQAVAEETAEPEDRGTIAP